MKSLICIKCCTNPTSDVYITTRSPRMDPILLVSIHLSAGIWHPYHQSVVYVCGVCDVCGIRDVCGICDVCDT